MPTLAQIQKQINALPHRYVFYTKKEIRYLPEVLADDERILALTSGYMNNSTWLCVCTDRRVLFLDRGMFFGLRQVQMSLDRIQSIDSSYTIIFGALRFWDGASSITIKMVLKSSIHPFVKTVQEAMDVYKRQMVYDLANSATNAHRSAQTTGSITHTDLTSELERLGKLHETGHLSDAEFKQAKQKLLQS